MARRSNETSNEEVLKRVGGKRELLTVICKRQLSFLGHIYRKGHLESIVLTGKIGGKRARGRQRKTFLESLRERSGRRYDSNSTMLKASLDREEWKSMIAKSLDMAHNDDDQWRRGVERCRGVVVKHTDLQHRDYQTHSSMCHF